MTSVLTLRDLTGHEQIDDVGLIHMGGWVYDPILGRFLQADPFIQQPNNIQNFNRYSYVLNNPLNATDPSGYFFQLLVVWAVNYVAAATAATAFGTALGMALTAYQYYGYAQMAVGAMRAIDGGGKAMANFAGGMAKGYAKGLAFNAAMGGLMKLGQAAADSPNAPQPVNNEQGTSSTDGHGAGQSTQKSDNGTVSGSRLGNGKDSTHVPDSRVLTNSDFDWIPEDGYGSPDDAAIAGLKMAKSMGKPEIEFGGGVVKIGDGFWFTEPVTQGLSHDFAATILVPEGGALAGVYHTHPAGTLSNIFSPHDTSTAHALGVKSYIGIHQNDSIRYYDPATMRPRRIHGIRNAARGNELCSSCF